MERQGTHIAGRTGGWERRSDEEDERQKDREGGGGHMIESGTERKNGWNKWGHQRESEITDRRAYWYGRERRRN